MPRLIRVEFSGAIYHVIARGNRREEIFLNDYDRKLFLKTLEEAVERFGLIVYAYCLMPNHYHLLIQTPDANLSRSIGWLQTTYTVRFNRLHGQNGHLFQGRFKAHLVEDDSYGRWLACYIHLNPVRDKEKKNYIASNRWNDLQAFPWSSHLAYCNGKSSYPWLNLSWLKSWGQNFELAKGNYIKKIRSCFGKGLEVPWENLKGGIALGSDHFFDGVQKKIQSINTNDSRQWLKREALSERRKKVQECLEEEHDEKIKIWLRICIGGERPRDVASQYRYQDQSAIGKVIRRLEQKATEDPALDQKLKSYKEKTKGDRDRGQLWTLDKMSNVQS